jgi:hypothetical protein
MKRTTFHRATSTITQKQFSRHTKSFLILFRANFPNYFAKIEVKLYTAECVVKRWHHITKAIIFEDTFDLRDESRTAELIKVIAIIFRDSARYKEKTCYDDTGIQLALDFLIRLKYQ